MKLRAHQNQALDAVLDTFDSGKDSAFLVMPAGTGKTALSFRIFSSMNEIHKLKSMAYVAPTNVMRAAFSGGSTSIFPKDGAMVKSFSYHQLFDDIKQYNVNSNQFDIIIFDDVNDAKQEEFGVVFNFFDRFVFVLYTLFWCFNIFFKFIYPVPAT